MAERRSIFRYEVIDRRYPEQWYVRDGQPDAPILGDICEDEDTRGRWMACPKGEDAFWPGFRSRCEAARWLKQAAEARGRGEPRPPIPALEDGP